MALTTIKPYTQTFVPVQEAVDACWSADAAKQKGHARRAVHVM